MWFLFGPPEAWSSEKSWLTEEEKNGGVVVYFDMLYSVFNARITIKKLQLISYIYCMKQCCKLREHAGDEHHQI